MSLPSPQRSFSQKGSCQFKIIFKTRKQTSDSRFVYFSVKLTIRQPLGQLVKPFRQNLRQTLGNSLQPWAIRQNLCWFCRRKSRSWFKPISSMNRIENQTHTHKHAWPWEINQWPQWISFAFFSESSDMNPQNLAPSQIRSCTFHKRWNSATLQNVSPPPVQDGNYVSAQFTSWTKFDEIFCG